MKETNLWDLYNRLADTHGKAPVVRDPGPSYGHRAIPGNDRSMDFVVSTEGIKRDGHTVLVEGFDFTNYDRNSVVLHCHNSEGLPIGKGSNLRTYRPKGKSKMLLGQCDFVPADIPIVGEQAEALRRLYAADIMRAVSASWKTLKARLLTDEELTKHGIDKDSPLFRYGVILFESMDFLEFSTVAIPSDPDALKRSCQQDGRLADLIKMPANYGKREIEIPNDGKYGLMHLDGSIPVVEEKLWVDLGRSGTEEDETETPTEQEPEVKTTRTIPFDIHKGLMTISRGATFHELPEGVQVRSHLKDQAEQAYAFVQDGTLRYLHHSVNADTLTVSELGLEQCAQRTAQDPTLTDEQRTEIRTHLAEHYKNTVLKTLPWETDEGRTYDSLQELYRGLPEKSVTRTIVEESIVQVANALFKTNRLLESWETEEAPQVGSLEMWQKIAATIRDLFPGGDSISATRYVVSEVAKAITPEWPPVTTVVPARDICEALGLQDGASFHDVSGAIRELLSKKPVTTETPVTASSTEPDPKALAALQRMAEKLETVTKEPVTDTGSILNSIIDKLGASVAPKGQVENED